MNADRMPFELLLLLAAFAWIGYLATLFAQHVLHGRSVRQGLITARRNMLRLTPARRIVDHHALGLRIAQRTADRLADDPVENDKADGSANGVADDHDAQSIAVSHARSVHPTRAEGDRW